MNEIQEGRGRAKGDEERRPPSGGSQALKPPRQCRLRTDRTSGSRLAVPTPASRWAGLGQNPGVCLLIQFFPSFKNYPNSSRWSSVPSVLLLP